MTFGCEKGIAKKRGVSIHQCGTIDIVIVVIILIVHQYGIPSFFAKFLRAC